MEILQILGLFFGLILVIVLIVLPFKLWGMADNITQMRKEYKQGVEAILQKQDETNELLFEISNKLNR